MYWTLELATKLEDAPWPATKEELIDYAQRTGAPMEVVENLQEIEDEGEVYECILSVFGAYRDKISTRRTVIIMFKPQIFSFRQIFFFIHFHHPPHYTTNRQRKQVLYRFFVPANSPLQTTEKICDAFF